MFRNNLFSALYHGIAGAAFIAGGYMAWNSDGKISEFLLYSTLAALLLSALSGFALRPAGGLRGALLSNGVLLLAALAALPVYAFYELALHAIYFYYIFHLPIPVVETFFPHLSIWPVFALTLLPYIAATLGQLLRRAVLPVRRSRSAALSTATTVLLCAAVLTAGCSSSGTDLNAYWKTPAGERELSQSYELKVLLVHGEDGFRSEAVPQQFNQTLYAGTDIHHAKLGELAGKLVERFDLVYLDDGLTNEPDWEEAAGQLMAYAAGGGTLYLPHDYGEAFPAEFVGVSGFSAVEDASLSFQYPQVRSNLKGLQEVWRTFSDIYGSYLGLDVRHHISFQKAAVPASATALVERDGLAYLTVNEWDQGKVIWSNRFLAPDVFITRLDLSPEDGGKYFHFGWATASMLLKSELVNLASKDKYGYSIKKAYGPYGRPGVAWQAHYEALYSFVLRDLMKWTELLQTYEQIPTYSLVRGSYNGGKWHEAIRFHDNLGTDAQPDFEGAELNSFFSSGRILQTGEDALWFDAYPGYNTFLSPIPDPYRAYPSLVPEDVDSEYDLVVGSADGQVYGIKKNGADGSAVTKEKLNAEGGSFAKRYSAPAAVDWNGDGKLDLLVGDESGRVKLFMREGSRYADKGYVKADGEDIRVEAYAAPHVADIDGDGIADLLVGDSAGQIYAYTGTGEGDGMSFKAAGALPIRTEMTYAAPFAADWNDDGLTDLLVGGYEGEIRLFLGDASGGWIDEGLLTGHHANFFGTETIKAGHYSVPVVTDWNGDGNKDLLTGHLEYGNTYSIDSPDFPYKEELQNTIRYAKDRYLSLIPHMYLHEYMDDAQERREMDAHKEAFRSLGIPWDDDDMGVNHHTWRINENALQTFRNQKATGIWWNFGFNPPKVSSAPRDGKEFLMVMPFMLPGTEPGAAGAATGEDASPFLLFSPAPHAVNFSKAWDGLARYDIPLIQFEHIEHGMKPFTSVYDNLIRQIETIDSFRKAHNYSAMTEDQIARSLLNTFYANLEVTWEGDEAVIRVNDDAVPEQVKEYAGTLGLRIEPGEKYEGYRLDTSSSFGWKGEDAFYAGLEHGLTSLKWTKESDEDGFIRIVRSNSPVKAEADGRSIKLTLSAKGMQDLKLYSPVPLDIRGKNLRVTKDGKEYTIVHYGEKMDITISAK